MLPPILYFIILTTNLLLKRNTAEKKEVQTLTAVHVYLQRFDLDHDNDSERFEQCQFGVITRKPVGCEEERSEGDSRDDISQSKH